MKKVATARKSATNTMTETAPRRHFADAAFDTPKPDPDAPIPLRPVEPTAALTLEAKAEVLDALLVDGVADVENVSAWIETIAILAGSEQNRVIHEWASGEPSNPSAEPEQVLKALRLIEHLAFFQQRLAKAERLAARSPASTAEVRHAS